MITVSELAQRCGATLEGGDPGRMVVAAGSLSDAGPDQVAPLTDARYAPLLATTKAAGVFCKKGDRPQGQPPATALLFCDDPEMAFLKAIGVLHPELPETPGIDARACVEPGAVIGANVYIGPFAVVRAGAQIGEGTQLLSGAYVGRQCRVGKRCRLYPHAVLYDGTVLGDEVSVHSGAVLGADGFGYKFRSGRHVKVPQVGVLRVGDRVEIGANTCVDRAALGETAIGEGSKIDNLVQIGHNVKTGKHVIMCGQAGVAGSVTIDDYAVLGANSGISDHTHIGMAARVGAKSGVMRDLAPKAEVFGLPADDRRTYWRDLAAYRKLPELLKRVRELEKRLQARDGKQE